MWIIDGAVGPGPWADNAECARRDVDMALEERTDRVPASVEKLRLVCLQCPVLGECRAWAMTEPDPAVGHMAGARTPRERWAIRLGRAM